MRITGSMITKIANSKFGIGGGIMAVFTGTLMLISNERDFKMIGDAIREAESVVVELDDANSLDTEMDGKLTYGVSTIQTDEFVVDELFDVSINAIKLTRVVKYYQWVEIEEEESDDESSYTTYYYEKQWTDAPVNSSKFNDSRYRSDNWVIMEIDNLTKWADIVNWGAYILPQFIKKEIKGENPVTINLSPQVKEMFEKALVKCASGHTASALIKASDHEYVHNFKVNTLHFGTDPSKPAIGDVRVEINHIPPGGDLSVIAQVMGNTFTEYIAKNGRTFFSVYNGNDSMEKMFKREHSNNAWNAWAMRVFLTILVILGMRFTLKPVNMLFSRIPLLGSIVNVGIKIATTMLGLAWSLIVIALAWFFYRPLITLIIFTVVAAIIFLLKKMGEKRA